MSGFNLESFTLTLLAEALFFDAEYTVMGNVGLVDPTTSRERFIAAYDPETEQYLIEEATAWNDADVEVLGYAIAEDTEIHGEYETAEETARVLLDLAQMENLLPSIIPLVEEM